MCQIVYGGGSPPTRLDETLSGAPGATAARRTAVGLGGAPRRDCGASNDGPVADPALGTVRRSCTSRDSRMFPSRYIRRVLLSGIATAAPLA